MSRTIWNLRYDLNDDRQRQVSRLHLSALLQDEFVDTVDAIRPEGDHSIILQVTFKSGRTVPYNAGLRSLNKTQPSSLRSDRKIAAKVTDRGRAAETTWHTRLLNPLLDEDG